MPLHYRRMSNMTPMRSCVFLLLILLSQTEVEACHNAQHVQPTSELDISGRKRRAVEDGYDQSMAQDADMELSEFFTECMLRKSGLVFQSWRSVIDLILRDTYWFEASDVEYCGGRKDTVKCWQRRLEYLLNSGSSLLGPGKECISDYDAKVKDDMGPEFELHYRTYYESFEYEPAFGEFKRWKRDYSGDVFDRANEILNNLDKELDVVFTPPRTYWMATPTTSTIRTTTTTGAPLQSLRQCPAYSLVQYGMCIATGVAEFVESILINDYPSLRNYSEESNSKFIQEHHSSCRITTEKSGDKIRFIENCDRSGSRSDIFPSKPPDGILKPSSTYRYHDLLFKPCLVLDFPEIIKPASPLHSIVSTCSDQFVNGTTTTTTTQPITTPNIYTIPTTLPYKRPTGKGRLGKCSPTDHWTRWYNLDNPDEQGDMETFNNILSTARGQLCEKPIAVEARTVKGHRYHSRSKEPLYLSIDDGLRCFNKEQKDGACQDYKIRFCCQTKIPECHGDNEWTEWLNGGRRDRVGDNEALQKHVLKNNVCLDPVAIRARLRKSKGHYLKGHDVLDMSPQTGLICKNSDQKKRPCRDYEVSFCCPK